MLKNNFSGVTYYKKLQKLLENQKAQETVQLLAVHALWTNT